MAMLKKTQRLLLSELTESSPRMRDIIEAMEHRALSVDERDEVTQFLTDVLVATGFDKGWEINERGQEIESLIDVFNPYKEP